MASPRITAATINQYARKRMDNTMRKRKLLEAMKSKGLVTFNHAGLKLEFPIKNNRAELSPFSPEGGTLSFSPVNRHTRGAIDWISYGITDSATKFDKLQNRNKEAIVKLFARQADDLLDDLEDQFSDEVYVNGTAAANAGRCWGVDTVFRQPQTVTAPTDLIRQRRIVPTAASTYAGIDMSLNAYGGSWTGTWPEGKGSAKYDFWTPLIVNYGVTTSGVWGTTDGTFKSNGRECLRYALKYTTRNDVKVDLVLLDVELYRTFMANLDANERLVVTRGGDSSLAVKLGWDDAINFEGATLTWEYGAPASCGYGFAFTGAKGTDGPGIELMSMQDQLFKLLAEDFDIESVTTRLAFDFYGNFKWNPRSMFKLQSGEVDDG